MSVGSAASVGATAQTTTESRWCDLPRRRATVSPARRLALRQPSRPVDYITSSTAAAAQLSAHTSENQFVSEKHRWPVKRSASWFATIRFMLTVLIMSSYSLYQMCNQYYAPTAAKCRNACFLDPGLGPQRLPTLLLRSAGAGEVLQLVCLSVTPCTLCPKKGSHQTLASNFVKS